MPRCLACCRFVRLLHGEYGLCRKCDHRLESDIGDWSRRLAGDLDRMVAFDAFCADRDSGGGGPRGVDRQRRTVADAAARRNRPVSN